MAEHGKNVSVAIQWHKCGIDLQDASRKQVLQVDIAQSHACTHQMSKWSGTCAFVENLVNEAITIIKEMYHSKEIKHARLGYTMRHNVSLSTTVQLTHEMIACEMPQATRMGKCHDPLQQLSLQRLIIKSSRQARIDKNKPHQQNRSASAVSSDSESSASDTRELGKALKL